MNRTSTSSTLRLGALISLCLLAAGAVIGVASAGARPMLPFKILAYNVVYKGSGPTR